MQHDAIGAQRMVWCGDARGGARRHSVRAELLRGWRGVSVRCTARLAGTCVNRYRLEAEFTESVASPGDASTQIQHDAVGRCTSIRRHTRKCFLKEIEDVETADIIASWIGIWQRVHVSATAPSVHSVGVRSVG